jgi:hypothetical protein
MEKVHALEMKSNQPGSELHEQQTEQGSNSIQIDPRN